MSADPSDPGEGAPPDGPEDGTVIGDAPLLPVAPADATQLADGAATPPSRLIEAGTLINNNYRILGLVSTGGMGEVYRAENVFTTDTVAIKIILPGLASDPAVLDLFRREARVLVQLRHDAIVRYHNFVLDGALQRHCLIMEFVAGQHLGDRLKARGPLEPETVLQLMRRLASGLRQAHDRGVTHRDLSPDNVILRDDRLDDPVLIDFGIARSTELGDGLAGRFAGKFKYIAPEQLGHHQGRVGPWTDVYGLGLLMACCARGKALPMGGNAVAASAARQVIPDLSGIPHRLFPLLQMMLEPDPAARPQDMGAVLRLIDDPMTLPAQYRLPLWPAASGAVEAEGDGGAESSSPFAMASPPPVSPATPDPRPRRRAWSALCAAGAVTLAATGWVLFRPAPDAPASVVPPAAVAQMAPRDGSTREGFLSEQPLPPCSFVSRSASGPDAGTLLMLSREAPDRGALAAAFEARFGARPAVRDVQVAAPQCPALDFLREIAGRPSAAPLLQARATPEGDALRLEGRATAAQGRSLWLFLVAPDGRIYDLTGQAAADAEGRFALAIRSADGAPEGGYILAAVANDQPLASVSAAPAGTAAADLLPHVLAELNGQGASPATAVVAVAASDGRAAAARVGGR
ncbi:serine/threonine protein kinase [Paracoccus sp. ME4]|uniref:serine/threonine protein kinase n=1 Tax=Paracoccus sp. ME4 TaxID=3138066 RepID=UPI00398ACD17